MVLSNAMTAPRTIDPGRIRCAARLFAQAAAKFHPFTVVPPVAVPNGTHAKINSLKPVPPKHNRVSPPSTSETSASVMSAQMSRPQFTVRNPPHDRPLMVYEGDCDFCRQWITRWKRMTDGQVEFCEFQELGERFPNISRAVFERAVQLIELDGRVLSGADAIFRLVDFMRRKRWFLRTLRGTPGFMSVARLAYRFIASHRSFFSWISARGRLP